MTRKTKLLKEFDRLVAVLDKKVKKLGIADEDIEEAIKWARQKKNNAKANRLKRPKNR